MVLKVEDSDLDRVKLVRDYALALGLEQVEYSETIGQNSAPRVYRDQCIFADFDHNTFVVNGNPITLTLTEKAILLALVKTPGEVVSIDTIADLALGNRRGHDSSNSVRHYIGTLRKKIEADLIFSTPEIPTL